ncbi:MAG: pyridoxamine 5'-phosphate oxidase family protein [Acidimicrobiales bacterium]
MRCGRRPLLCADAAIRLYHNRFRHVDIARLGPHHLLKRLPARGHHDPASVHGVLDEALVGHLAFVHDGTPFALPTIHARVGDVLYVHGSVASRMLRSATSQTVCFTATIVDGLVVARSAFHHSLNYRSAVVLGVPRRVEDPDEQRAALDAIVDHVLPGRPAEVRAHHDTEVRTTRVLALAIDEASAACAPAT